MANNPFNIVSGEADTHNSAKRPASSRSDRQNETRALFERQWLITPERFDPTRCAIGRERIERTWHLLKDLLIERNEKVVDLGFGWGTLTSRLLEAGAQVDAVDLSSHAIKRLQDQNQSIRFIREVIPPTSLEDSAYSIVLCTDLIADMHPNDRRLLVSEMYRLVKPKGHIVCSTPLDIDSEGPLPRFTGLVETELAIEQVILSHHAYFIRLVRFFRRPEQYARASRDAVYKDQQMTKRRGLSRRWFDLQCRQPFSFLWRCLSALARPLADRLENSRGLLLTLERVCRTLNADDGVSHAIVLAKRKPLQESAEIAESRMSRPEQRLRERIWE